MTKGFFTIAQGEEYIRFAYALALSLKESQNEHSKLSIGITPGTIVHEKYASAFDHIIEIPWGDAANKTSWKLENEWKAIYMSPYDQTIKLDADMLFPSDITAWWAVLEKSDIVFATEASTYRNDIVDSDYYRRCFTDNDLPNVYTAFFYFNKSEVSFELFKWAELIYNNWELFFATFMTAQYRPNYVSTDVVFAIAAKIMDITENDVMKLKGVPTFVHMKTQLQKWHVDRGTPEIPEDWNDIIQVYLNNECELMIGNYRQTLPFHYHLKHFLTDEMITTYEKKLGL